MKHLIQEITDMTDRVITSIIRSVNADLNGREYTLRRLFLELGFLLAFVGLLIGSSFAFLSAAAEQQGRGPQYTEQYRTVNFN